MRILILLLMMLLSAGCSRNHFNVPAETFADKVRVLGVVPIIIDSSSDIRHPQKELLISTLAEMNRRHESQLVRKIKSTENFYTVTLLDIDPRQFFSNAFFRREKRNDATIEYNKYFWKSGAISDYMRRNRLDAIMTVVISGITRSDKISSTTMLSSLTSEYNFLIMTAQILDADGTILWEYPNFRPRLLSFDPFINLQYPDFSEAEANLLPKANVKFKSLDGIKHKLDVRSKDMLMREKQDSELYDQHFEEMLSYLKYDVDKKKVPARRDEPGQPATEPARPAEPAAKIPPSAPATNVAPVDGKATSSGQIY